MLEARLPDGPQSHLCLRAWHCPISGDSAFLPEDGQATGEPGLWHRAKPLKSQQLGGALAKLLGLPM